MNIEEIKAREQAATRGPWKVGDGTHQSLFNGRNAVISQDERYLVTERAVYPNAPDFNDQVFSNIDFIAHARTDIPALIAEVKRMEAENSTLKKELEMAIKDINHIANEIADCKEFLSISTEKVSALKLGRCDVCKGICHDDKPCHFEWRGIQQAQEPHGNKMQGEAEK